MKLTAEEIEQGLADLGLSEEKNRQALSALSHLQQVEPRPKYETITAAHTSTEPKEKANAELEPGS